jgi:hypothetical protein
VLTRGAAPSTMARNSIERSTMARSSPRGSTWPRAAPSELGRGRALTGAVVEDAAAVALLGGVSLALLADDRGRAPGAARRASPRPWSSSPKCRRWAAPSPIARSSPGGSTITAAVGSLLDGHHLGRCVVAPRYRFCCWRAARSACMRRLTSLTLTSSTVPACTSCRRRDTSAAQAAEISSSSEVAGGGSLLGNAMVAVYTLRDCSPKHRAPWVTLWRCFSAVWLPCASLAANGFV